jgi:hypothetical protein
MSWIGLLADTEVRFMRRILVASNAIQTMDNYPLFEFEVRRLKRA